MRLDIGTIWVHDTGMSPQDQPVRLVKLLMPADVVRQMDQAILAADGAYQGRADFITEAVRDRISEEAALRSAAIEREAAGQMARRPSLSATDFVSFGAWIELEPPAAIASPTDVVSFGLHNRDLPTIWAFDLLAQAAAEARGQVSWADFVAQVGKKSVGVGEWLRMRDLARERGIQASTGFPRPGPKQVQSVERFITTMVGSLRRTDGPLFDLALVVAANGEGSLLPSEPGLAAVGAMLQGGLGYDLPQPEPAFRSWWQHLATWAPAERDVWLRVIRLVADAPNREDLVAGFPEWPGSTAHTNTAGFVSRSREWGLIEPELIDGRYRLTALGELVAEEE